jgi:hypothetical protein
VAYRTVAEAFSVEPDALLMSTGKALMKQATRTELTGLSCVHLSTITDKVKLRSAMQATVKYLKSLNAQWQDAEEAKEAPTSALATTLKERIVGALKLK